MEKGKKKQFSLSILVKILIGLLVVVSIGVFANSLMRVNALREEEKELEKILDGLIETREELNELLGSGEAVEALLRDYEQYQLLLQSNTAVGDALEALEQQKQELQTLIHSSKYKDHIVKIAKEKLGLYFADEEIIYNDKNN